MTWLLAPSRRYCRFSTLLSDSSVAEAEVVGIGNVEAIGGLIGRNLGVVENSHATGGNVKGEYIKVGGLIGLNADDGEVKDSYAMDQEVQSDPSQQASSNVGGLIGRNRGTVTGSHALNQLVRARSIVGGLAGNNVAGATITGSYAQDSRVQADGSSGRAGGFV